MLCIALLRQSLTVSVFSLIPQSTYVNVKRMISLKRQMQANSSQYPLPQKQQNLIGENSDHLNLGSFCRYRSTDYVSLRKTKEIKDRKQNNSK